MATTAFGQAPNIPPVACHQGVLVARRYGLTSKCPREKSKAKPLGVMEEYMGVSLNNGFPPISHPKCWSFLVGFNPWVCWGFTNHFRKTPISQLVRSKKNIPKTVFFGGMCFFSFEFQQTHGFCCLSWGVVISMKRLEMDLYLKT